METTTEVLVFLRQIAKAYEVCLEDVRDAYQLTTMEAAILCFLTNNPERDTVAEIAEGRMLSRGNVSRGADCLIRRGLLERVPDKIDRRWVHLRPLPASQPVMEAIQSAIDRFQEGIFAGFSPREREAISYLHQKISDNAVRITERSSARNAR